MPPSKKSKPAATSGGQPYIPRKHVQLCEIRIPDATERSAEQKAIIARASLSDKDAPYTVRVNACAGSGKTTTMVAVAIEKAHRLVKSAVQKVYYLTFSKQAVGDIQARVNTHDTSVKKHIVCATLHQFALALLKSAGVKVQILQEYAGKDGTNLTYAKFCAIHLEVYLESFINKYLPHTTRANVINERNFKSTIIKQLGTLLDRAFGAAATVEESLCGPSAIPAALRQWYEESFTYPVDSLIHVDTSTVEGPAELFQPTFELTLMALELWRCMVNESMFTHDGYTKRAQTMMVPGKLGMGRVHLNLSTARYIILDECQDMTECQIAMVHNHASATKYYIGDAAQTIYQFRRAQSRNMYRLPGIIEEFALTHSFRFGPAVANVANVILYGKTNQAMTPREQALGPHWTPFTVTGASPTFGRQCTHAEMIEMLLQRKRDGITGPSAQATVLASANAYLLKSMFKYLLEGFTISATGGASLKWGKHFYFIRILHRVYTGAIDTLPFDELEGVHLATWEEAKTVIREMDVADLTPYINLVDELGAAVPKFLDAMENALRETNPSADLLLCTVHGSKGLEWDNVLLLDDLLKLQDLLVFECAYDPIADKVRAKFAWPSIMSAAVNQWYVAVTRARSAVAVPPEYPIFMECMLVLAGVVNHAPDRGITFVPEEEVFKVEWFRDGCPKSIILPPCSLRYIVVFASEWVAECATDRVQVPIKIEVKEEQLSEIDQEL